MKRFRVDAASVKLVPGWFEDTLAGSLDGIGPIAVLRLDNDWYKSTKYCLELLYERVVDRGYIIIDDYHTLTGCKKAVDEFRELRGIKSALVTTEIGTEAYWQKNQR